MNRKAQIVGGAGCIGAGAMLAFVGQWLVTGQVPPAEFWMTAAALLAGAVGWLVKIYGKGDE